MLRESVGRKEISAIEISEKLKITFYCSADPHFGRVPKHNRELNWGAAGLKLPLSLFATPHADPGSEPISLEPLGMTRKLFLHPALQESNSSVRDETKHTPTAATQLDQSRSAREEWSTESLDAALPG